MDDFFFSLVLAGVSVGAVYALVALGIIAALGMFIERYTVRPALKSTGSMGWVVSTLGFGIFLQGVAAKWFGSQAVAFPDVLFSAQDYVSVFGQHVSLQYLLCWWSRSR